jgi:hypothetical protein
LACPGWEEKKIVFFIFHPVFFLLPTIKSQQEHKTHQAPKLNEAKMILTPALNKNVF